MSQTFFPRRSESRPHASASAPAFGFGGWLIWFQIRLYGGVAVIAASIILYGFDYITMLQLAMTAASLVFFYLHKVVFRIIFIVGAALGHLATMYLIVYVSGYFLPALIFLLLLDIIIIISLFRSKRVRDTFN